MKLFEQIKTKNIQEMAEFMCDNFDCGICPAFDANYCANANLMFSSKAMKKYLESECEIKCGNCEHYKPIEKYTGYCILHKLPAHETGTCREGKKKDSGQTLLDLKDGGKGGGYCEDFKHNADFVKVKHDRKENTCPLSLNNNCVPMACSCGAVDNLTCRCLLRAYYIGCKEATEKINAKLKEHPEIKEIHIQEA